MNRHRGFSLRVGTATCFAAALMMTSGCLERGFSTRDQELERLKGFALVSAEPSRAVVAARGRQVVVEPADRFCVAEESVETSLKSAFMLIGDCVGDAALEQATTTELGELQLPRALPGIITVSISGDAMFNNAETEAQTLDDLMAFLQTPKGLSMLGRDGKLSGDVQIVDSRTLGRGLYVFIEESTVENLSLLSERFWRAFVELNGRLTIVTVSGFRDRPISDQAMLAYLTNQVVHLRQANDTVPSDDELILARQVPNSPDNLLEVVSEDVDSAVGKRSEKPAERNGRTPQSRSDLAADATTATRFAPRRAPTAPRRRGPA